MDNDNKVEKREVSNIQRHKDVLLFLNEELNNLQLKTSSDTYNLEREYAKTKKNKSPFVPLLLVGCFLLVLGAALLINYTISKQNEQITVNLEAFHDLNLKNLLDGITKAQDRYDNAVKQAQMYETTMENKLQEAETKRDDALFLAKELGASATVKQNEINQQYEEAVELIRAEYEPKIAEMKQKIEQYEKELSKYDSSQIQSAKANDSALDAERRVQEMERQRLVDMYESQIEDLKLQLEGSKSSNNMRSAVGQVSDKYKAEIDKLDPVLRDEKAKEIIKDNQYKITKTFNSELSLSLSQIEDETVQNAFSQYQDLYDKYKYLRKAVAAIPQKNSIPSYVSTTNKIVDQMGETFADAMIKMQEDKASLNLQIDDLTGQLAALQEEMQKELSKMEQMYKRVGYAYADCINEMLNQTNHNAVVVYSTSASSVVIFVTPRARYLITADGAPVEITGKKTIRGTIYPFDQGYYKFVPAVSEEEGSEEEFNFRDVVAGSPVKLLDGNE